MKKQTKLLALVILFVVVLGGAYFLYDRLAGTAPGGEITVDDAPGTVESETDGEEAGEEGSAPVAAPDFTVVDGQGNEVKLSDFQGTPVVLNFWASWCPPCKSEMPDFEAVYQTYGEQVQFMMVNLTDGSRETQDTADAYLQEAGYTFPVFYDTAMEAAIAYSVTAVPATYLINADGELVAYGRGALDQATLENSLPMILE